MADGKISHITNGNFTWTNNMNTPNNNMNNTQTDNETTANNEIAAEIVDELKAALSENEQATQPEHNHTNTETLSDQMDSTDNSDERDAEIAKLKDQLLRSVAEAENIRKRAERDLQEARKYAITGFARDMVGIAENLQLALQNIPEQDRQNDEKLNNLAQGVEMTYNELLRVFETHGITRIEPIGEKFDHNLHQAVAQIEDPKSKPGTVVQVLQAGYTIQDRLLRPAMVTVAKGSSESPNIDTQA